MNQIYLKYSTETPPKYPQSFTGKERDSETGFSYFGARYYDSDVLTGWLSVDPLADKYPNISPYAYCAWNPVKLVDPDGEEIVFEDNKAKILFIVKFFIKKSTPFGALFLNGCGSRIRTSDLRVMSCKRGF